MIRALRAEWTKLRSVPSTPWLALAAICCFVATGAAVLASLGSEPCSPVPPGCDEDTVALSLTGVYLAQAAVVVLAVLAVSPEYSFRTMRSTLSACPRRPVVLLAKVTVVLAIVLGAGTVGVLGAVGLGRLMLPLAGLTAEAGYPPLSLADGPTLRATAGTVLYLGLVAMLGLGLAFALRDTTFSLITVLGLLLALPMVAALVKDQVWRERMERFSPMTAGLAVRATKRLDALPIGPWQGLGLLAAYAGATVVIGAVLFRIRDA
jgi:ABC-2 type transport system permease protein